MSISYTAALLTQVPLTVLFAFYNIYFIGRWGQTVGKMAMKIRVQALGGNPAGFARALYRHSVDLSFSLVSTALTIYAFISVTGAEYDLLDLKGKMELLEKNTPAMSATIDRLMWLWIGSELVVLLLNEKRRALHDFIAGTVVVHTGEQHAAV